jgi:hypothetical protein
MKPGTAPATRDHDRPAVIRDMIVFQLKLVVDGLLDLVLLPASLIAGLVGVIRGGPDPGSEFYELMRFGRRGERWINLFGAVNPEREPAPNAQPLSASDMDDLVTRVESFLVDEYRKREVTAQTRQGLNAALDSLQRLRKQGKGSGPGQA